MFAEYSTQSCFTCHADQYRLAAADSALVKGSRFRVYRTSKRGGFPVSWGCQDLIEAGLTETGLMDACLIQEGLIEAGLIEASLMDACVIEAGLIEAGLMDAGLIEAGLIEEHERSGVRFSLIPSLATKACTQCICTAGCSIEQECMIGRIIEKECTCEKFCD